MPAKNLVVLTGAGISAESGLRTFRDGDGLWEGYRIEDVATPEAWRKDPQLVLDFYNQRRRDVSAAVPNDAHKGLAALEKDFNVTIITQNIDDLHERAGSTNVIHLHGEIFKMCSEHDRSSVAAIRRDIALGDLASDGHQFRPDIVWFGEPVPMMETAIVHAVRANFFAVVGTSLQVYPAAGLIQYVPAGCLTFLIDKKIPYVRETGGITFIEKPATEGIQMLREALKLMPL